MRQIEGAGTESIAVFADRWLVEFPRPSARSNEVMAYQIRAFVREFGHRSLDEITPREARSWAVRQPNAARRARTLYEDALSIGLADSNPFQGLRLHRKGSESAVPSEEEVATLILATPHPYRNAVGLAAYTGLRLGELLGIRPDDLSEDRRQLLVERQRVGEGRYTPPKNGHARTIAVLPQAQDYLPDREQGDYFPFSRQALEKNWRRARKRAGCDAVVFHSLRHFCATWLLNRGARPTDIGVQLGHRDGGRLVQELYGHPDDAIARERLRAIAAAD